MIFCNSFQSCKLVLFFYLSFIFSYFLLFSHFLIFKYFIKEKLDGEEGILVASKIADRVGITRSVIVNALRKFESAGVIESRSSGMKGTYIKVLNEVIFDELEEIKAQRSKKS